MDEYIKTINGANADLINTHKLHGKSRENFASHLSKLYNISMTEAETITNEFYDSRPELKKSGFFSRLKDQASSTIEIKSSPSNKQKEQLSFDRKKTELEASGVAYCPKCLSTSLSADKKGFGVGKAVVGAATAGLIGLTAGNINAKKVRVTCLKCGHQFWAGKQ